MAEDLKRVGLVFKADGAVDFQKSLQDINNAIKENYGNFKVAQSEWDKSTSAVKKLEDRQKYLAAQTEEYSQKVTRLNEVLEQQENAEERDEKAIAKTKQEIANTQAKLNDYERSLKDVTQQLESGAAAAKELGETLQNTGEKVTKAGKEMSKVSAGIAAVGVASVKTAADFDSSMSQVQATMGISSDAMSDLNGETVNTMDAMRNLAKEMGASTAFSASECADAINYLALAGYNTQEVYDTLPTVLNLAAAGGMDLASASDMVTDAMSALGMETSEADAMVDQMAKTASSSNTSVAQLGEALLTIGATGRTVAGGTNELNTALGILADNGIKGSEGGTHLRNVIMSLQNPVDKAADAMEELGIQVYDSQGKMKPLNVILEDFNTKMDGMTDEKKSNIINKIFNKTDIASVNALLANSGDRWNELSVAIDGAWYTADSLSQSLQNNVGKSIDDVSQSLEQFGITADDVAYCLDACGGDAADFVDTLWEVSEDAGSAEEILDAMGLTLDDIQTSFDGASGAAQQMADTQLDNLNGQMTLLKSAVEGGAISIGERLMPYISQLVGWVQQAVDWFNSLSDTQLDMIIHIAGVVAAIGPLLVIIGQVISFVGMVSSGIGALMAAWATLSGVLSAGGTILGGLVAVFGAVNLAVVAVIAAIAAAIAIGVAIYKNWDKIIEVGKNLVNTLKNAFTQMWNSVTTTFNNIKTTISNAITTALNTVQNVFNNMKTAVANAVTNIFSAVSEKFNSIKTTISNVLSGALSTVTGFVSKLKSAFNFSWSLPSLKIPHISVSGGVAPFGIGGMGSLPKFSIKWNKEGLILKRPTIVGSIGNTALGGGEAGEEAFMPIEKFKNYQYEVNRVTNSELLNGMREVFGPLLVESFITALKTMKLDVILNDEVIAELFAEFIKKKVFG